MFVAECKSKKKNPRSTMLSSVMKAISGALGDKMATAYARGDSETFLSLWNSAGQKIIGRLGNKT